MAFDFKKEYKEFYMPKNKPQIVEVPSMNYIAVRGQGDPNAENREYQRAIGVLYAVAYTLKMSYKTDHKIEQQNQYVIYPYKQSTAKKRVPEITLRTDCQQITETDPNSQTHNLSQMFPVSILHLKTSHCYPTVQQNNRAK